MKVAKWAGSSRRLGTPPTTSRGWWTPIRGGIAALYQWGLSGLPPFEFVGEW